MFLLWTKSSIKSYFESTNSQQKTHRTNSSSYYSCKHVCRERDLCSSVRLVKHFDLRSRFEDSVTTPEWSKKLLPRRKLKQIWTKTRSRSSRGLIWLTVRRRRNAQQGTVEPEIKHHQKGTGGAAAFTTAAKPYGLNGARPRESSPSSITNNTFPILKPKNFHFGSGGRERGTEKSWQTSKFICVFLKYFNRLNSCFR